MWRLCVVAAAGVLALCSCGQQSSSGDTASPSPSPSAAADPYPARYAAYPYGGEAEPRVIDLGTVVSSMQTTYLTECLRHDALLARRLAERGWSLRAHAFRNGGEILPYQDGRIDALVLGDSAAIRALNSADFTIYSTISTGQISLVARTKMMPAELKGRRVGFAPNTVTHFAVYRSVQLGHLGMGDIVPVTVQADQALEALEQGRVDAVSVYEPYTSSIVHRLPESSVVSRTTIYTFFVLDRTFAEQHPDIARELLAAAGRAALWLRSSESATKTCLGWIKQAQVDFLGSSLVEPGEPWVSQLRRETVDTPSYPLLPQDLSGPESVMAQQFQFARAQGWLAADTDWNQLLVRFKPAEMAEILARADEFRLTEFDYAANP